MESTISEHESEIKWDEGQIWVKTCHSATRKFLARLLSRHNEEQLHITTTELDLSSGDSLDYGPRFIMPFPRNKMREYVDYEQPWDKFDIHGLNILDGPELYRFRRWYNAKYVIGVLHCTLKNFYGDDTPRRIADEE